MLFQVLFKIQILDEWEVYLYVIIPSPPEEEGNIHTETLYDLVIFIFSDCDS